MDNHDKGVENSRVMFILLIGLLFNNVVLVRVVPAQKLLFNDSEVCGLRPAWSFLLDTLNTYGVEVHYIADEGWVNIMEMDAIWIEAPSTHAPDGPNYPDSIIDLLQFFSKHGGRIVLGDLSTSCAAMVSLNKILMDTAWQTTIEIEYAATPTASYCIVVPFPPFTYGSEYICSYGRDMICGKHSFPFVIGIGSGWYDSLLFYTAAISYPFQHEGNCSSYIVVITGTDVWTNDAYEYAEATDDYIFARNILLTAAGVTGYELPPCAVPEPYIIEVDSGQVCANVGDTVTLFGKDMWQGNRMDIWRNMEVDSIEIYLHGPPDTVIIPIEYSNYAACCSTLYNTWLKFIVPDIPWGTYLLELGHKAITFDGGEITIPCEWFAIEVDSAPLCANIGDTVALFGDNLYPDIAIYIGDTIISPLSYSADSAMLEFVCPELLWGAYPLHLERGRASEDCGIIVVPCDTPNVCFAHPLPFTPNGDGINDFAKFEYPGMHRNNGVLSIYTLENQFVREVRNGDVYDSPKGVIFWDGKDGYGRLMENGVYLYVVQDGGKTVCKGTVYLAR